MGNVTFTKLDKDSILFAHYSQFKNEYNAKTLVFFFMNSLSSWCTTLSTSSVVVDFFVFSSSFFSSSFPLSGTYIYLYTHTHTCMYQCRKYHTHTNTFIHSHMMSIFSLSSFHRIKITSTIWNKASCIFVIEAWLYIKKIDKFNVFSFVFGTGIYLLYVRESHHYTVYGKHKS